MSTEVTWHIDCTNLEQSLQLASDLGARLRGGEVIELMSDVGGGKTTFVKGIVKGIGSTEHVSSPSFTISNQYRNNDVTVYHFDFYRLNDAGLMQQELADAMGDPKGVVIVEWANVVENVLPLDRLRVQIVVTSEVGRNYTFAASENLGYLKG